MTVVIPNWNGGVRLRRVVSDLAAQTSAVERVLIVDNGSVDRSADDFGAGAEYPMATDVIRLEFNTGFAHAVNVGIRAATTELVAIVNNDVELPPTWLSTLLEAMEPGDEFAVGKIYSAKEKTTLDATFDSTALSRCSWRCGAGKPDSAVYNQTRRIHSAPLTAAVFRKRLFDTHGLLDERFESYLEDVDLGMRVGLAGLSGVYVPQAVAFHWGSATLGVWHRETTRRLARNQVFLVAKYPPRTWFSRTGWKILAGQLLWGLVAIRNGVLLPWLTGKWQGLRGWGHLGAASRDFDRLESLLRQDEKQIRELQAGQDSDLYWKLYFALT